MNNCDFGEERVLKNDDGVPLPPVDLDGLDIPGYKKSSKRGDVLKQSTLFFVGIGSKVLGFIGCKFLQDSYGINGYTLFFSICVVVWAFSPDIFWIIDNATNIFKR